MAKKRKNKSFLLLISLFFSAILIFIGWYYYTYLWNARIKNGGRYLYVKHTDYVQDVAKNLKDMGCITDEKKFIYLSQKMKLHDNLNPGRYYLRKNATLREIILLIKNKKEDLMEINIPSGFHKMEEFLDFMDGKIEAAYEELEAHFQNHEKIWNDFELMQEESIGMLIPGKIKISWAISANDFYQIFKKKFYEFWNREDVKSLLKKHPLQRNQIITLASIVQCESGVLSEQRKIAGVYINRLRKNMLLQADPTVVFATGKWNNQRVYAKDLEINSPYNTYKYPGLPPGPLLNPYLTSVKSVLEYEKHAYLYFCAKPELNGYSNYSSTFEEHIRYAKAYQKKLNELKIK